MDIATQLGIPHQGELGSRSVHSNRFALGCITCQERFDGDGADSSSTNLNVRTLCVQGRKKGLSGGGGGKRETDFSRLVGFARYVALEKKRAKPTYNNMSQDVTERDQTQ